MVNLINDFRAVLYRTMHSPTKSNETEIRGRGTIHGGEK